MKIVISKVVEKETENGKKYLYIEDKEGKKYSSWITDTKGKSLSHVSCLKEGNTIEADVTTKGKYSSITNATLITGNQPDTSKPMTDIPQDVWDKKNRIATRTMIASYVCEHLIATGKIENMDFESFATKIFDWVYEKEKEIPF